VRIRAGDKEKPIFTQGPKPPHDPADNKNIFLNNMSEDIENGSEEISNKIREHYEDILKDVQMLKEVDPILLKMMHTLPSHIEPSPLLR